MIGGSGVCFTIVLFGTAKGKPHYTFRPLPGSLVFESLFGHKGPEFSNLPSGGSLLVIRSPNYKTATKLLQPKFRMSDSSYTMKPGKQPSKRIRVEGFGSSQTLALSPKAYVKLDRSLEATLLDS